VSLLPTLPVLRVLRRDRRGSSAPVVVETSGGLHLLKLRGAAQGAGALVAEVIVAALADHLGLPVPARRVLTLAPDAPTDDRNDELADVLHASIGDNLGFRYIAAARPFHPGELERISPDFASQVRWLDWLVMNPDRSLANPNILVDGPRFWLIDHGAALHFQYDWASVTEESPGQPGPTHPHLFDAAATRLAEWDPLLTAMLSRAVLGHVVGQVPLSFLGPLLPTGSPPGEVERRRAAYVAYLRKRLDGPRPFQSRPLTTHG
jgi:hypothetical protein